MSSTPLAFEQHPKNDNRRLYARRRFEELTYATFGGENGGILINIGEGGLRFQGFRVVPRDELVRLTFKLPGMDIPIEAAGQVTWSNDSGKGGGLRFVDLSEEMRRLVNDWVAKDVSSTGTFKAQVTVNPAPVGGLGAALKNPVQSIPVPDEKVQPKTAPIRPEYVAATVSSNVSTSAGWNPGFETEPRIPEAQSAEKPQYLVFAAGVLAGCVVVLAAIAGIRMLGSPDRISLPNEVESPAAQHATAAISQSSPAGAIDPNDGRSILNNETVNPPPANPAPAASQSFINRAPKGKKAADEPNLALRAPHMPTPPSKAEVREPSVADSAPPVLTPLSDPRTMAPARPELPGFSQQIQPQVAPRTNYVQAVAIEHPSPVYPLGARNQRIEGIVKVGATIGTDGVPRELKLVSGNPALAQAAMDAISRWRYVPAVSGGLPVESHVVIAINFQFKQ